MNRFMIRVKYGIAAAALTALTACGGGGGGGAAGGAGEGAFTATLLQPTAGATFSVAAAVNVNDEVVGMSNGDPADPAAFRAVAWTVTAAGAATTSVVTSLAMPPGAGTYSAAYGNNSSGAVVGELEAAPAGAVRAAFWPSRTAAPAEVVLLSQGTATRSAAYDLNTSGRIVGELDFGTSSAAVTWADSTAAPVELPPVPGQLAATAFFINDTGEIAGEAANAAGNRAVLWKPDGTGAYTAAPVILPGSATLSGDGSALAINAAGAIVGEVVNNTGIMHAALWTPGAGGVYTLTDLGLAAAGSSASGISDGGRVVGHAHTTVDVPATARTWAPGAGTSVLMDAALGSSEAYAINAANRAVGLAGTQAFFAVPR
jgi:uncharacterized membrane protein